MTQEPLFAMEDPSTEPGPRPFSEIPPLWLKVFQMHEDFFAAELPRASASNAMLGIVVMSAVAALISWNEPAKHERSPAACRGLGSSRDLLYSQLTQGNDTDSFGATAGSILGAYFGPEGLEAWWLAPLNDDLRTGLASQQG